MVFNKFSLAPVAMLRGASSFKDRDPGGPIQIYGNDSSYEAYAWYIQGRDKEQYYFESEYIERDPKYDLKSLGKIISIAYNDDNSISYIVIDPEYETIRYKVKEIDNKYIISQYWYYSAVKKPIFNETNIYTILYDMFSLMEYYDVYIAKNTLEDDIYHIFAEETRLFNIEIEIVLAILNSQHTRRLYKKLASNIPRFTSFIESKQDIDYYVTPDVNAINKDYIQTLLTYMPIYLGICIPRRLLTSKFINYPSQDIIPINNNRYYTKVIDREPLNEIYACSIQTLYARIDEHLPPVLKLKEFPWKSQNSGCVIAGGFLQVLSNNVTYNVKQYDKSDIDLFIYGYEDDSRILLNNIISLLSQYGYTFSAYGITQLTQSCIRYSIYGSVINAINPAYKNTIQIVCTNNINFYQIIYRFDNSSVQIAFDGNKLYVTPDFNYHIVYGQAHIFPPYITADRIIKLYNRGYIPVSSSDFLLNRKVNTRTWSIGIDSLISVDRKIKIYEKDIPTIPIPNIQDIKFTSFKRSRYLGFLGQKLDMNIINQQTRINNVLNTIIVGSIYNNEILLEILYDKNASNNEFINAIDVDIIYRNLANKLSLLDNHSIINEFKRLSSIKKIDKSTHNVILEELEKIDKEKQRFEKPFNIISYVHNPYPKMNKDVFDFIFLNYKAKLIYKLLLTNSPLFFGGYNSDFNIGKHYKHSIHNLYTMKIDNKPTYAYGTRKLQLSNIINDAELSVRIHPIALSNNINESSAFISSIHIN